MAPLLWVLLATGCRFEAPEADPDLPFGGTGTGVVRLGPPAASGGVYDVAPYPEGGVLFVSNQRVPFITMVDRETGEWLDAIDLRLTGEQRFPEQRVSLLDGVLLAPNETGNAMLRYDPDSLEGLDSILTGAPMASFTTWQDELWISLPNTVTRYRGHAPVSDFDTDFIGDCISVDDQHVALADTVAQELHLFSRQGDPLWSVETELESISAVLAQGGRLFVADRLTGQVLAFEDGEQVASATVGADVVSLTAHDGKVLAVARLGASLPESGAWQGDPAIVVAMDADLTPLWSTETDKGARFLSWDGEFMWTAAEGAQRLVAIDPDDGSIALRSHPLAMTLDHLTRHGNRVYFSSHITDSFWWVDFGDDSYGSTETCGWPSSSRAHGDGIWLACQDHGELWQLDPDTLDLIQAQQPAETFHAPCLDATCEGAHVGVDMAIDRGVLVYSDPYLPGLRWSDGRPPVRIKPADMETERAQHLGVRVLGRNLLVHEPFTQHTWLVERSAARDLGTRLGSSNAAFPLVGGGDEVWLGGADIGPDLSQRVDLGLNIYVVAVNDRWLVTEHGWDIEVYDLHTLALLAEQSLAALRAPPFVQSTAGEPGPLHYMIVEPDLLLIGNTFRATLELRRLPGLEPIGSDEPLPLGDWEHLSGIR